MKTAVFVERDGILVKRVRDGKQERPPYGLHELQINTGIIPLLHEIQESGLMVIVTTNQPGIAQGAFTRRDLEHIHDLLRHQLPIDQIQFCPHDEADECGCRKPLPGQLREAEMEHRLDINHSYVLSDQWQDAAAAQAIGCTSILVDSPRNGTGHRDFVLPTVQEAIQKIVHLHTHQSELFMH